MPSDVPQETIDVFSSMLQQNMFRQLIFKEVSVILGVLVLLDFFKMPKEVFELFSILHMKFLSIQDFFEFFEEASSLPSFLRMLPKYFKYFEKHFSHKLKMVSSGLTSKTKFKETCKLKMNVRLVRAFVQEGSSISSKAMLMLLESYFFGFLDHSLFRESLVQSEAQEVDCLNEKHCIYIKWDLEMVRLLSSKHITSRPVFIGSSIPVFFSLDFDRTNKRISFSVECKQRQTDHLNHALDIFLRDSSAQNSKKLKLCLLELKSGFFKRNQNEKTLKTFDFGKNHQIHPGSILHFRCFIRYDPVISILNNIQNNSDNEDLFPEREWTETEEKHKWVDYKNYKFLTNEVLGISFSKNYFIKSLNKASFETCKGVSGRILMEKLYTLKKASEMMDCWSI